MAVRDAQVGGDRIVSLDGDPTSEMDLTEFVELALGREGTAVELLVVSGGEERTVTLTRRTMEP